MLDNSQTAETVRPPRPRDPGTIKIRALAGMKGRLPMTMPEIARLAELGIGETIGFVDALVASGHLVQVRPGRFARLPKAASIKGAVLRAFLTEESITVSEIAGKMDVDRITIAATLRILYAEGWLKRHMHGRYSIAG